MMMIRTYLAVVGLLYASLAMWCSLSPGATSAKVGLNLQGASGQSEFLAVYGGLEMGLALVLLIPLFAADTQQTILLVCVLIHASLVTFRTIGFVAFHGFDPMTYNLAVGEWLIFLSSATLLFWKRGG